MLPTEAVVERKIHFNHSLTLVTGTGAKRRESRCRQIHAVSSPPRRHRPILNHGQCRGAELLSPLYTYNVLIQKHILLQFLCWVKSQYIIFFSSSYLLIPVKNEIKIEEEDVNIVNDKGNKVPVKFCHYEDLLYS